MNQVEVPNLRKKIGKFQITAKNLILSVSTFINSICKVNQPNQLRFAV